MNRSFLPILKILLGILATIILLYNFQIAYKHRYEAGGDAANFIELGVSLAKFQKYGNLSYEQGSIIEAFKLDQFPESKVSFKGHSTWRPPVWPFLIAGIFLIFGYNLTYILIFKFSLHFLGAYIFYKVLRLLNLRQIVIILGTFLYVLSPAWQHYSRFFLSEPITFFFLTLWLYLLVSFLKGSSGFLPQALIGGLIILSHPYYVFLPFSIWLVLCLKSEMKLKVFFASSLICASLVSVWIIRNMVFLDTNEIVLTTSSGAVMAKGWNRNVVEEHTNTQGDLADETLVLNEYDYDKTVTRNELEMMQLYKNATIHFIRSNPDLILPITGRKLLSAFNPYPETNKPGLLETGRWFFQFFALVALIYILVFTKNKLIRSLAIGLILSTIGITILTYSGFRFRMPQVGLEILLIAFMIDDLLIKNKKWHPRLTPRSDIRGDQL